MRLSVVTMAVCLLTSVSLALPGPRPAFDPGAVVSQVRQARQPEHPRAHGARPRRPVSAPTAGRDDGEFLVDTSMVLATGPYGRSVPAVAYNGTNFLVVWEEDRSADSSFDVYGARVTPAGEVLDPVGIAIAEAPSDQNAPAVASDGSSFLVVWEDGRNGEYLDIYGARVTPAGTVLDPAGIAIATAPRTQYSAGAAFDGENFFVVWQDWRNTGTSDIYGARVTPGGVVLDTQGIPVSQDTSDQYRPAVSFDGTNSLVVWEDVRSGTSWDIYGARVTPQGEVLDSTGIVISQGARDEYYADVASAGETCLVAWEDYGSVSTELRGARVTSEGVVLDPTGIAIAEAPDEQVLVAAGSDGQNFFLVWEDYRGGSADIYGARVTTQGVLLDTSGIALWQAEENQCSPAIGFGGGCFLVAWENLRMGDYKDSIVGVRVSPDGTVLDSTGILISRAVQDQYSPAAAFDGTNFLVVWEDGRSVNGHDIYGARVTPEGAVLDPAGFVISQADRDQSSPAVAFDGSNFLVVWHDYRNFFVDIYGARVTSGGAVLDTQGIAISQAECDKYYPAVGFDGANYLVVWDDIRGGSSSDIYGARVTPEGVVLDSSGIAVARGAQYETAPAVEFGGSSYLVVWQDDRAGYEQDDIYGARITPAGAVLDSAGIAISAAAHGQVAPAVSSDGANFLVVWQDLRSGVDSDIYGTRVTTGGVVLDTGIVISAGVGDQRLPAAAFDGADFLVAWQDSRAGSEWDIYGARVTPAGAVTDSWPVTTQQLAQLRVDLAGASENRTLAVYQSWTRDAGGRTYNAPRIWGKLRLSGGVEEGSKPQAASRRPGPTIVRGVLFLSEALSLKPQAASLFDASGRKVLDLHGGANDVSRLAPGVYFVQEAQAQAVRKVVITH